MALANISANSKERSVHSSALQPIVMLLKQGSEDVKAEVTKLLRSKYGFRQRRYI